MTNDETIQRVARAIRSAWDEFGDVPFPLYEREAMALAEAAVREFALPRALGTI